MTDDERNELVDRLRGAVGTGDLDLDEMETRLDAVVRARTTGELERLRADLPDPRPAPPPVHAGRARLPALGNAVFRSHLVMWALVNAFLVGIWALTSPGGFFWPFFPAAGWGIGLGAHYVAAARYEAAKERRREVRGRRDAHQLGSAGSGAHRPPSRRYVAAMFVDVVGSTELNEALGDESWSQVRGSHRALLGDCFNAHGGHEVNAAGDGVLARFSDPADAARAAIEIQRRLADRRAGNGFAPSVRIGVHSGDVVDEGDDVVGSVVNLASRVTDAAEADQILVTEHVADHLPATLDTRDHGMYTLKGVSRPRHLLALVWQ